MNTEADSRTCDRCYWWSQGEVPADMLFSAGACRNELCQEPDPRFENAEEMAEVTFTGPKFGCIHWEQK